MSIGASYCLVMIRVSQHPLEERSPDSLSTRGIAGGVVSQTYFETHFGIINADGSVNKSRDVTISSNVVSVLQAGAFFGALGSAPISGRRRDVPCASRLCVDMGSFLQHALDVEGLSSDLPSCFASVP